MPTYYARGASGIVYPVNISGAEPNAQEQKNIQDYLASQGDQSTDLIQTEDTGEGNFFTRGISRGVDTLQLGLGSALEGAGTVTGIDWLEEFGEGVVETNKQQLAEQEQYATRLDDVKDVGSGLTFFGETLAEQAPQLGSTLGGSMAGAAIGTAIMPGFGTVLGGVAGGLAVNLPFFYGMNREAQKDMLQPGEEVNEGIAALTSIPQSALDLIADRLLIGSIATPALIRGGGLFTRSAKGVAVGTAAEVPTEVGQTVLERMQAGKDLTSEEAMREYYEVAVAAGLVGGTVRGVSQAVDNYDAKEAAKVRDQVETDLVDVKREIHSDISAARKLRDQVDEDIETEKQVARQGLDLEKQNLKDQEEKEKIDAGSRTFPMNKLPDEVQTQVRQARSVMGVNPNAAMTTPQELRDLGLNDIGDTIQAQQSGTARAKREDRAAVKPKFSQAQYDAAVEAVKRDGEATVETIRAAAKTPKGNKVAPSVAEAIRDEMIVNRVARQADSSRVTALTEEEVAQDPTLALKEDVASTKKRLEELRKLKEEQKVLQDKILNEWKATPEDENNLTEIKRQADEIDKSILAAEARARNVQRQIDTIESRTEAAGDLSKQTTTQEQANLALRAAAAAERAPERVEYKKKQQKIAAQLKKDLKKIVGADVKLDTSLPEIEVGAVNPETGRPVTVQGSYNPSKKLIALAMDIYDPSLTEAQRLDKLRGVLNHEVIHALRDIELFTEAEWSTLSKAAAKRKFVAIKDGEQVQRDYTFMDRARRLNGKRPNETVQQYEERVTEEAVAEMFRAWADGKLKVTAKPLSLFKRIVNFFTNVQTIHAQNGFASADAIFENIQSGKVATRDRAAEGRAKSRHSMTDDLSGIPTDELVDMVPDSIRTPKKEELRAGREKSSLKYNDEVALLAGLHRLAENNLNPQAMPEDEDNPFTHTPKLNAKGKPTTMKKEVALALLQHERNNRVLDPDNPKDFELIAKAFAAFAEPAIKRDASAIGWYEAKLRASKELLHNIAIAQGKNRTVLTDPEMEAAFDFALAITSNGMSVIENFESAKEQLDHWEETGEFLVKGYGERVKAMESAFAFYNSLKADKKDENGNVIKKGLSDLEIAEYLMQEHTVGEMKKHPLVVEFGLTVPSGELASERMPLAFLFGPKIGAGFYMNLRGNFDKLTADVWFMRLWNYITGDPFKQPKAADIQKNKDIILERLREGPESEFEARIISEVMQDNNIDIITDANIEKFAVLLNQRFQREFNNASTRNTDKIKAYAAERGINWKSEEAKRNTPDLEERPEKTDIFKKADTLTKQLSPQEQATPRNGTQRRQIRKTIERSREILKDGGYDINTADFQAVVWYPMKQLLASLGVSKGTGGDNDYVDGAIALVRREGATDAEIAEALPDSERERIDIAGRSTEPDGRVRDPDAGDVASEVASDQRRASQKASEAGVSDQEVVYYSSVPAVEGLNTLKDFIKNNPDGFTITPSGQSVPIGTPDSGVVVAPIKSAELIVGQEIPLDVLRKYVENAKEMSSLLNREVFLGGWFNSDDSQYYLDNVLIVDNLEEALYIAQAADQIAVYNLAVPPFGEEVNTNEGIRKLQEAGSYRGDTAEQYRRSISEASDRFGASRVQSPDQRQTENAEQSGLIDFFNEEDPFTENLSPEEDASVRAINDAFVKSEPDYSAIPRFTEPPAKPQQPIPNPIALRARERGETVKNPYLFGMIRDGRRFLSVHLFAGQDGEEKPIESMGNFGLYHIQQRDHDMELTENSKYGDVTQAIYDMMRVWQRQDYQDGPGVVAIPDGGIQNRDIRMEWVNPTHNSPPLVLSLEYRPTPSGQGLYSVRTFFPQLDKKKKKQTDYSSIPLDMSVAGIQETQDHIVYSKSYQVLSKILRLGGLISDKKAKEISDGFAVRFQDRFLPVAQIVDDLRSKGATITDAMDPYLQETLYHGVVGEKVDTATQGLYEPVARTVATLDLDAGTNYEGLAAGSAFVRAAEETTGSKKLAVAEAYLYALHAKERNEYIRSINPGEDSGSGMTDAEADRIISWVSSLDSGNRATLESVRAGVRDIVDNTNKVRRDGDLVPLDFETGDVEIDDSGDEVRPAPEFTEYVPLRGILDPMGEANEEGTFASTGGRKFGVRGKEDRAMLGRGEYASNILSGVFMQNQNAIIRSEKNAVGKSFLSLLRNNRQAMAGLAVELEGRPMRRGLVDGVVKIVPDLQALNDPTIAVVKEDGREVYIKMLDPRLAQAINGTLGMSVQTGNAVVSAMGKLNRYLSNINTSYNPEFFITNVVRDIQTAGVNVNQYEMKGLTSEIMRNFKGAFKGIRRVVVKGQESSITKEQAEADGFDINALEEADVFRLFQLYGGQNALNQMSDLSDQVNNVKGIIGDISEAGARGQWNKVKNSFVGKGTGSLLSFLENYNTVAENAIRVATFKALAPKIGMQRAAFAARNVTVDFAKGGEYKTAMNAAYLFYNASIQGSFALINAATRSPKVRKIWASLIVLGVLQDQLNAALSEEDEDGELIYDKTPQYILEHNIILPDPFGVTDRSEIAIPMPYGLNMAINAGRALSRAARGKYTPSEATSSILGTAVDTLNPLGGTESFFNFVAPTVADPFIDIVENKDFAGKPIVKEVSSYDPTPPPDSQLFWSTTSPSLKWISENLNALTGGSKVEKGFIDVSPDTIDFWLGYLTGGAGMFVQRTGDFAFGTIPTALTDGFEDEFIRQTPFVRKVFYSVSDREDLSNFVEGRNKVLKSREILEAAIESGDPSKVRSVRSRLDSELRIHGQIKALNSARNRLLRQIKQVQDNPRLPDAQKEKIVKRLGEQIDKVVQRANRLINENL
jgi:hypothetical protein